MRVQWAYSEGTVRVQWGYSEDTGPNQLLFLLLTRRHTILVLFGQAVSEKTFYIVNGRGRHQKFNRSISALGRDATFPWSRALTHPPR